MRKPTKERVRVHNVEVLADDWYTLRKTTFDFQRKNGEWQRLTRETYDRGNGATILPYNRARKTVVLIRQFRFPAFVNEHDGMLIETCAGLLDNDDAETCIRKEAEEETGYRMNNVKKVFESFMSPGSVTERLHFFVGEYGEPNRVGEGGGLMSDGEDIDVLEIPLDEALQMIDDGRIADGKTIMLLQYVKLKGLLD